MISTAGWQTLLYKEVLRFWKVSFQTVAAPVLTAVLYLMIFGHVLEDHVKVYDRIPYTVFLVPGLVMMSVLQNAFDKFYWQQVGAATLRNGTPSTARVGTPGRPREWSITVSRRFQ